MRARPKSSSASRSRLEVPVSDAGLCAAASTERLPSLLVSAYAMGKFEPSRGPTVTAGSSGSRSVTLNGSCGPEDEDSSDFYVRVRGVGAPAFECRTYALQYSFTQGCLAFDNR